MECCLSSYHGWLHCDVSGVWYLASGILGWRPLMAGRMVALWRALFRLWWLPSRVVWAMVGVAVSSSDMPSLSKRQRPNQDLGIEHRGATLEDLMVARVGCRAKALRFVADDGAALFLKTLLWCSSLWLGFR